MGSYIKRLFAGISTLLNCLTLQGRKSLIVSTQWLSNVKNLCTYRKGSQKEKISTFSCRATKTPSRKILYWQKNQPKKFIFPSVWSCWFAALLSGATVAFLDHVLSTSKRSIYPKLNGLHYQDLWPRYYYAVCITSHFRMPQQQNIVPPWK